MKPASITRCKVDVQGRRSSSRAVARPWGIAFRWGLSFALVLGLHLGAAAYFLAPSPDQTEGNPDDAISIDLLPDPSEQAEKPDDVAGPQVADSAAATSEKPDAHDPDPPAPEAPPPSEVQPKPETTAPEAVAPPSPAEAEAILPPETEVKPDPKPDERPPDPTPPVEKPPEVRDKIERQTAPSQASSGSAALLSGGRRPSAAAVATWRSSIGTHLGRHRRFPQEARDRRMQGTPKVRVTIDANGHVLGRELAQSSGRPLLDEEALALMSRSDPFPKPPPGMPSPIVLTVPVKFAIR